MNYKRATLISDSRSKAMLKISVSDKGDVYLKVVSGDEHSEVVLFKKGGATNDNILEKFSEIVDVYKCDMPIGSTVDVDGISYVCTKSSNDCEGCAFEHSRKCPDVYCCADERADGFDILFKEK